MNPAMFMPSGGGGKAMQYTVIGIFSIIVAVLLYFFVYKPWLEKKKALQNNAINTPTGNAKIIATKFRVAMEGWGTNEKLLYTLADQVANDGVKWEDVASNYYNMYERDLIKDLQKELNSKEIQEFWSKVNAKKNTATTKTASSTVKSTATTSTKTVTVPKVPVPTNNPIIPFSFLSFS